MRGAGTLRNIIGKPLYGKKKKQQQQQNEEADLHEGPTKKQKLRKSSSTGGVGQRSIFNFFSVAAASATAAANPNHDPLSEPQSRRAGPEHPFPPRCKSAPVQCSDTPNSTPAAESPSTSSRSSERALPPPDATNSQAVTQQQQQQQQQQAAPPRASPQPSGPLLVTSSQAVSQQQQQQQSAAPCTSTQVSGPLLVTTRVVGRQHQSAPWPPAPGCTLLLQREPSNPVDPCAILVCSVDGFGIRRTHGHLPAAVSCHLAPLMDRGNVTLQVQLGKPSAAAAAERTSVSQSGTPQLFESAAAAAAESYDNAAAARSLETAAAAAADTAGTARSGSSTDASPAVVPDADAPAAAEVAAAAAIGAAAVIAFGSSRDVSLVPAAEAIGEGCAPAQQQQQEQRLLQLQVVISPEAAPEAAALALSAVDRAASAGLDSVAPGRSSGAMLAAAFEHILSETRKHDLHLLSQQEQAVLQHMQVLPAAAKALLLRLLLRKRTWFQLSTLAYADVPQPETAASRLSAVGLLQWSSDAGADLDSLLQGLPVVVLKQVLAGLLPKGHPAIQQANAAAAAAGGGYAAPNKAVLVSSIQANACRVRLQAAIAAAAAGPCVAVTPAAADTFARLQLLYFASPGHDLNMFVAVERGAVRYPIYPIQRTQPVFSSRQQVLEYEQALAAAAAVDAALEAGDADAAWHQLQPALSALQAGVHKAIVWDEACAPLPNPPPRQHPVPAVTVSAVPSCTNTRDLSGSPVPELSAPVANLSAPVCGWSAAVPDQSAPRQEPSAPAVAAGVMQQLPSVAAASSPATSNAPSAPAAAAAAGAAGTSQQLPSVAAAAAAASSPETSTAQPPPSVAAVVSVTTKGALLVPQQLAEGVAVATTGPFIVPQQPAEEVASVQTSRFKSSESDAQHDVGIAVQSVQQGAAAGESRDEQQLGDLGNNVGVGPGPEVCDLTQASSSDVSWDTADSDGQDTAAAAAAAAAGGAVSRSPAAQQQQQACAQADCLLELATDVRAQGPTNALGIQQHQQHQQHQQQQLQQESHQPGVTNAHAAMATLPAAAAVAGSDNRSPVGRAPPLFFARFCAGWVYASLGTVAGSLLEKRKAWGEAVELLRLLLGGNACVGRRGEWWTRLAINLEHLGRTEDALEAVEAALADAWVRGGDLLGLQRRYLRLGKPPRRWRRPPWATAVGWEPPEVVITARPLNNTIGAKSRFYAPDNALVTVEQLALQHYASKEGGAWQGLHCEGGVWTSLFTLLLWDVLFMGVPDVFRSPFQTCPLDLDTDAFYPTRSSRLEAQLSRIADGQAGSILSDVWVANAGVMARGINWRRFTQQQLLEICECVGGLGLAAVLRLMAEDHAGAAGGLPDLLLWRPSDKSAKLVEVKGPRDRLSNQQRFWLAHMFNNTLQVEVLKVKEPQSSRRK